MDKNDELFKGTSFADLMSDVYHNSKKKDRQINQLIAQLSPLIKNASDATVIVPLIKEYLDVAVKNDDHLVKLTAIVQRYISTKQTIANVDGALSEEEKQYLLKVAESTMTSELESELDSMNDDNDKLNINTDSIKQKLTKESDV